MMNTGFSLVDLATGLEVAEWHGDTPPRRVEFRAGGTLVLRVEAVKPGNTLIGSDGKEYRFAKRVSVPAPGRFYTANGDMDKTLDGDTLTVDPKWAFKPGYARSTLIAELKANAGARITAVAPEWKQRNMLARGAQFLRIGEVNLDATQQAELAEMDAVWAWVEATRRHSDALEAEVEGLTDEALKTWEPHGWPEFGA